MYIVYDIVYNIVYYIVELTIMNFHLATIFQEEQGLQLELAVLRSRCPEPLCPGHASPEQWTENGQGDPVIRNSVPWGYVVQTAGQHNHFHPLNSMHNPGHCCLEETGLEQGL
jgi:hypothetical protein